MAKKPGRVQSKRRKKKSRLERIHHWIWIIAGLTIIIFAILGIQLFIDAKKYFP